MLPVPVQFIIALVAYALNERMANALLSDHERDDGGVERHAERRFAEVAAVGVASRCDEALT